MRMWKFPCFYDLPGVHISPLGVVPEKNKLADSGLSVSIVVFHRSFPTHK